MNAIRELIRATGRTGEELRDMTVEFQLTQPGEKRSREQIQTAYNRQFGTIDESSEDPRIRPRTGCALRKNGKTREVLEFFKSMDEVQWTWDPNCGCSRICSLRAWQRWAKDSEVVADAR